jgi:hypothetical protein
MANSDDDALESLLTRTFGTSDVPRLSPGFGRKVQRHLRHRRLGPAGRMALWLYALAATVASVAAMRAGGLDWTVVAVTMVASFLALGALSRAGEWVGRLPHSDV